MIILVFDESVQRPVGSVVLAGLYLYRNSRQTVVVVDEIVNFALASVVVVEQAVPVRVQFACYRRFVDGAQIDAVFALENGADVVPV